MKDLFHNEFLNRARAEAERRYGKPFPLDPQFSVRRVKPKSAFLLELEAKSAAAKTSVVSIRRKSK